MDTAPLRRLAALDPGVGARLAVVVTVAGHTYRGPGALRLWVEGEAPCGVIGGGCVEADLDQRPAPAGPGQLLGYDLSPGEERPWSLGAGCGGRLEVWLQALPPGMPHPYRSAARWVAAGLPAAVTTVLPGGLQWAEAPGGLRCGALARAPGPGERVFVDRRAPAPELLVCGGGPDTAAVLDLGRRLGFRVRQAAGPDPAGLVRGAPAPDAAVVMGHHVERDRAVLEALLAAPGGPPRYVGVVGPRARTAGLLAGPWPSCLHAPAGLDLGAEDAEEVALAIVAEVVAALHGHAGGRLGGRPGPIHPERARIPS
jgi:xanthine/CO dehydrogenase XdhC/CoxF family maturation factor